MAMVGVDSSTLHVDSQPNAFGLVWGSAATWHRSTHQMNRVNSHNGSAMMIAPINIAIKFVLLLLFLD